MTCLSLRAAAFIVASCSVGVAAIILGVGALFLLRGSGGMGKLTDGLGPKRKKGASRLSNLDDELETADRDDYDDDDDGYNSGDADDIIGDDDDDSRSRPNL